MTNLRQKEDINMEVVKKSEGGFTFKCLHNKRAIKANERLCYFKPEKKPENTEAQAKKRPKLD